LQWNEAQDFFKSLWQIVSELRGSQEPRTYRIDLLGIDIQISFFEDSLIQKIMPALAHITDRIPLENNLQYQIFMLDGTTLQSSLPKIVDIKNKYIFRGDIENFCTEQYQISYLVHPKMICSIDHFNKIGIVVAQDTKLIPRFITASPLKEIFSWVLSKNKSLLIHAAAVGNQDGAVLLIGKSGAGKSSTAIRCLLNGLDFYGDDVVGISTDPTPTVHSIYASAKIYQKDLKNYKGLALPDAMGYLSPNEKAIFYLHQNFQAQLNSCAPIRAILHVVQSDGSTQISPTSVANALNTVGSTTATLFPYFDKTQTTQLLALFKKVPCFKFELGNRPDQISLILTQFLETVAHNEFS